MPHTAATTTSIDRTLSVACPTMGRMDGGIEDLLRGERRGREVAYSLEDDHVLHIATDALAHAAERS